MCEKLLANLVVEDYAVELLGTDGNTGEPSVKCRRRRLPRQQLRPRRLPRPQARPRAGRHLPLAPGRQPAGVRAGGAPRRLRLRRLPARRRPRRAVAGDGRGQAPRRGGRPGARHLQRLPGAARGGADPGRHAAQPEPPLPLPRRPSARRARRPPLHLEAAAGRGAPPADRPRRGELRGLARAARRPGGQRPGRLPLRDAGRRAGRRRRAMEPQRRGARHRRHLQPPAATSSA